MLKNGVMECVKAYVLVKSLKGLHAYRVINEVYDLVVRCVVLVCVALTVLVDCIRFTV